MAILETDEIEQLKSQVNIADLISQYVALSRNGKNFIGLCPFHGEKTPSFNVNAEKGFYHCFGCGKSGDVIEFLKEYKQISFIDAVKELANFAGVQLNLPSEKVENNNPNAPLYDINNQAARLYNILLMSTEIGQEARSYLEKRGISSEIIKQFNIGLAPIEEDFIYKNLSNKFEEEILANSGLFHFSNNKVFDAFTNRIMFPITNEYGHTIGFSGRIWQKNDSSKAKYVNTAVTSIFDKSYELWNLDKAKPTISRHHEVYLMEGFMDVIAAYKSGVFNVVASMGTALTEKHIRRLRQIARKFVLVYDGDSAGQNAIYKAINLIGEKATQIVKIPERLDPDEYLKTYGSNALSTLMESGRIQPIEFLIDFMKPENISNLQVQLDYIEKIAPMIARVPSITAQDAYVRKLVEILPDFEYNQVERAVNLRRENVSFDEDTSVSTDEYVLPQGDSDYVSVPNDGYFDSLVSGQELVTTTIPVVKAPKLSRIERAEEQLLNRMINHPSVLKKFAQDENFRFIHKKYQDLFDKLLLEGMAFGQINDSHFASELDEGERALFYQIISLDLPDLVTSLELEDLISNFLRENEKLKLEDFIAQLDVAKKSGNKERVLELTLQIINQKKKI